MILIYFSIDRCDFPLFFALIMSYTSSLEGSYYFVSTLLTEKKDSVSLISFSYCLKFISDRDIEYKEKWYIYIYICKNIYTLFYTYHFDSPNQSPDRVSISKAHCILVWERRAVQELHSRSMEWSSWSFVYHLIRSTDWRLISNVISFIVTLDQLIP